MLNCRLAYMRRHNRKGKTTFTRFRAFPRFVRARVIKCAWGGHWGTMVVSFTGCVWQRSDYHILRINVAHSFVAFAPNGSLLPM